MKLKTHKAAKKRIKITGSGKLRTEKAARKHLLTNKSKRQKKGYKNGRAVPKGDAKNMRKLLPNG